MSSPQVATLCGARTWQCEAHFLRPCEKVSYARELQVYTDHWNLSRSILLVKNASKFFTLRVASFRCAQLPAAMRVAGIDHLTRAVIFMWRPICLWPTSTHANGSVQNKLREIKVL